MFTSLKSYNFRLFLTGQAISQSGTWLQNIALGWLVLKLTGSGAALGTIAAIQFLPMLILGLWGGVIADRFNKRHLLYFTSITYGLLSLTLAYLVSSGHIYIWALYVLAALTGFVTIVDNPARQAFLSEMVGHDTVTNAISLNATIFNATRVVGPFLAGVIIATSGIAACFWLNALSFAAVLITVYLMRADELSPPLLMKKRIRSHDMLDGFTYAWHTPVLRAVLVMMFILGAFVYEFQVSFPVFAKTTLEGNASTLSVMMAAVGIGSVAGGLIVARKPFRRVTQIPLIAAAFGLIITVVALMPSLAAVSLVLILMGLVSTFFTTLGNSTLQVYSRSDMRGRVMSLWGIGFMGTTPIGAPIVGWLCDMFGAPFALVFGGIAALFAALIGYRILTRHKSTLAVPPAAQPSLTGS